MVERGTGNIHMEVIEDRKQQTLTPCIRKIVKNGTTIITDKWKGYSNLSQFYRHQTVNHSKNFIEPETGAYTQTIEGHWSILKRKRASNIQKDTFLIEHLFKR